MPRCDRIPFSVALLSCFALFTNRVACWLLSKPFPCLIITSSTPACQNRNSLINEMNLIRRNHEYVNIIHSRTHKTKSMDQAWSRMKVLSMYSRWLTILMGFSRKCRCSKWTDMSVAGRWLPRRSATHQGANWPRSDALCGRNESQCRLAPERWERGTFRRSQKLYFHLPLMIIHPDHSPCLPFHFVLQRGTSFVDFWRLIHPGGN